MAISSSSTGLRPGVCTSTTRPTTPYTGQIVFETDTFALKFWNGSSWQGAVSAPAGTVNPYAGSTAPTGWLLCAGQAVSRTTYADLFSVVSTTYGSGDGSTTFNVPDLRGRAIAGKDDMGGSAASRLTSGNSGITGTTLGAAGGDERYHQHSHSNTVTNNAVTSGNDSPDHAHLTFTQSTSAALTPGPNGTFVYSAGTGASSSGATARHQHSVTSNVTISNANAGSGASQNVQPTIILNYIIKF